MKKRKRISFFSEESPLTGIEETTMLIREKITQERRTRKVRLSLWNVALSAT